MNICLHIIWTTKQGTVMNDDLELMLGKLCEILDRTKRTECRMVQLGDHVGANLRTKLHIDVKKDEHDTWVEVDALDVSISRIIAELKRLGIKKGTHLPVRLNGGTIATVFAE